MKPRIRKRNNEWAIVIENCQGCTLGEINTAYRICEFFNRTERKLTLVA